jgi:hypothetical protein
MIQPLTTMRAGWPAQHPASADAVESAPASRFLYVWTSNPAVRHTDFLAVVDVGVGSPAYGTVIATVPVGSRGIVSRPKQAGERAAGHGSQDEQILLFDFVEPSRPRVVRTMAPPLRLCDHAAADGLGEGSGPAGFLRSARSADATDGRTGPAVHPRGLVVLSDVDRLVTIGASGSNGSAGAVVQLWRLSDLTLLCTLDVPRPRLPDGTVTVLPHALPFVSGVLPGGSVLLHAYGCGVYRLTGADSDLPHIHAEHTVDTRGLVADVLDTCGVPVVVGDHWIIPSARLRSLVVLDVRDPDHPVEVSWLSTGSTFRPHWIAHDPASHRVIVGAEDGGINRMLMARFESPGGQLTWDESFRAHDGTLGVSFESPGLRAAGPGIACPRAALFRP